MRFPFPWSRFPSAGRVWMIPTHLIRAAAPPLRQEFDYPSLVALSRSLMEEGMLSPLLITMEGSTPLLVCGHRRLKAAKIAGLREVPCLIIAANRERSARLPLVENGQRMALSDKERTAGGEVLRRQFGYTDKEVVTLLGRRETVKPPAPPPPKTKPPAPLVGDMRLFINSLNHTVDTMRQSGIAAEIAQTERDKCTELTIRIPKRRVG